MIFSGWRTSKGQTLSACYLLSSTVLLMFVIFTVEDVVFPSKCNSCRISWDHSVGVLVNIGKSRPLFQRSPLAELQNTSRVVSSDRSRPRSKVSLADVEISEKENHVERSDEVDLTEQPGTDVAEDRISILETQTKNESRGESLQIQEDGDPQSTTLEQANSKVEESDVEQKEGSSTAPLLPPLVVHSVNYYTKYYKHPVSEVRVLTANDGAPRIQSNVPPPDREITIVTQTSADRLPALETTCMTWGGAMCVAVHVRLQSEIASTYEQVTEMSARVEEQSGCRLDVQLVTEDGFETEEDALQALYPVNALRNVALGMAKTKLIFLLDADFKPSPRLHESLTEKEETYQDLLRQATEERQLFVIPAFEAGPVKGHHPTSEQVTVPETMEELKDGWEKQTIVCFHCKQSPTGHMPTKFEKFFNPATTSAYSIFYRDGFEPYVIGARDAIPPYDARFRGYGENKVSHLYSCAADGMGFQVLPNVFVFELPHPPSKARDTYVGKHKDPDNRPRIIGLYNQFKLEVSKKQMEKDPDAYGIFLYNLIEKN